MPEQFLTIEDVADRYKVSPWTVRKWRAQSNGPKGIRLGRHVRYPLSECEKWEDEQRAS